MDKSNTRNAPRLRRLTGRRTAYHQCRRSWRRPRMIGPQPGGSPLPPGWSAEGVDPGGKPPKPVRDPVPEPGPRLVRQGIDHLIHGLRRGLGDHRVHETAGGPGEAAQIGVGGVDGTAPHGDLPPARKRPWQLASLQEDRYHEQPVGVAEIDDRASRGGGPVCRDEPEVVRKLRRQRPALRPERGALRWIQPIRRLMKASSLIMRARESKISRRSGSFVTASSQNLAARLPSRRRSSTIWAGRPSAQPWPESATW